MNPAPPVTNCFTSLQVDRAVVADHHPCRPRTLTTADDLDVPTDERVGEPGHTDDATVLEHDGVLDLGVDHLAVVGDRRERAHIRVHESCAGADHRRTAHSGSNELRAFLDHHTTVDV